MVNFEPLIAGLIYVTTGLLTIIWAGFSMFDNNLENNGGIAFDLQPFKIWKFLDFGVNWDKKTQLSSSPKTTLLGCCVTFIAAIYISIFMLSVLWVNRSQISSIWATRINVFSLWSLFSEMVQIFSIEFIPFKLYIYLTGRTWKLESQSEWIVVAAYFVISET